MHPVRKMTRVEISAELARNAEWLLASRSAGISKTGWALVRSLEQRQDELRRALRRANDKSGDES